MVTYTNIPQIMQSCATLEARIAMVDTILSGMETAMSAAAEGAQFEEYKLDTGQTKNEVRYRSMEELTRAYEAMLLLQDKLYTRLNRRRQGGGSVRLVPNNNFI